MKPYTVRTVFILNWIIGRPHNVTNCNIVLVKTRVERVCVRCTFCWWVTAKQTFSRWGRAAGSVTCTVRAQYSGTRARTAKTVFKDAIVSAIAWTIDCSVSMIVCTMSFIFTKTMRCNNRTECELYCYEHRTTGILKNCLLKLQTCDFFFFFLSDLLATSTVVLFQTRAISYKRSTDKNNFIKLSFNSIIVDYFTYKIFLKANGWYYRMVSLFSKIKSTQMYNYNL